MSKLFTSVSTWIKFLVSLHNSPLAQIVLDLWHGGLLEAFDQLKKGEISIEGFIASLPDWVKRLFQEYVEKQVSTQVANQVAAHVATAVSNVVTDAVTSAVSTVSAAPSASDIAKAVVAEVAQSGASVTPAVPAVASVLEGSTGDAALSSTAAVSLEVAAKAAGTSLLEKVVGL